MKGISGTILHVNLTTKIIEKHEYPPEFYRKYLGGGAIGAYFLLTGVKGLKGTAFKKSKEDFEGSNDLEDDFKGTELENGFKGTELEKEFPNTNTEPLTAKLPHTLNTELQADPLSPANILTIAAGLATGAPVSGAGRCSVTALSPETGAIGDTQAGGNFGPYLKRAGFDALVITGKAEKLSYLHIKNGEARLVEKPELAGLTILEAHDLLAPLKKNISVLQCGPAGEKLVKFAALASDRNNYFGRTGMGAVFGSKNLRAVVVEPSPKTPKIDFYDLDELKRLAKKSAKKAQGIGFIQILKEHGTPGIIGGNALSGNLSTHNYSSGFHKNYEKLDGSSFSKKIGSKGTTCYGCIVGCRKTVKCDTPYPVTDQLGGPEFETLGILGSNLDITDPVVVAKANELCNNLGLDTISMGGLISYLFEAIEKEVIDEKSTGLDSCGFSNPEALLELIKRTAYREGIGDVLADGFQAAVAHFGKKSAPYAVQVKNHGFAVHMTQVKQSMALMYAVSPIGADHMSCEHDWLNTDSSDVGAGLGLVSAGLQDSTGPDKVRSIMYSQFYYGLLDSLCLCMFCWACGSMFDYRDLEDLVTAATGGQTTFWELMKAGQRRVNMMRLINIKRGFTSEHDMLPDKVFEKLTDGPSKGKCVDRAALKDMIKTYYGMMGWDRQGVPKQELLQELDLSEFSK